MPAELMSAAQYDERARSCSSSSGSSSRGTPGPVNKNLKSVMQQEHSFIAASPAASAHSLHGLVSHDSFHSQLQDSDFAPGTPLKVWGNVMFDDDNVAVISPPRSPSAATEASANDSFHPDAPPCKIATPSQSFASDISPSSWAVGVKTLLNSRQREEAARLAAPSGGSLARCYIKRVKGLLGSNCSYQMFLEDGDVPLLISRRVALSKSSAYLIATSPEALKREADCTSKLKSNFLGTEFLLSSGASSSEELCINFKANGLTVGPRSMSAVLPVPESQWQPADGGLGAAMAQAKERSLPAQLERELAIICNKPPEFDESRKCFTLLFKGRKVVTSKKNCQLVGWDHRTDRVGAECLLQFAKLQEDRYALDFAYPLNSLTAFAMALANMDEKLCHKI